MPEHSCPDLKGWMISQNSHDSIGALGGHLSVHGKESSPFKWNVLTSIGDMKAETMIFFVKIPEQSIT